MSSGNARVESASDLNPSIKWWVWMIVAAVSGILFSLALLMLPFEVDLRIYIIVGVLVFLLVLWHNPNLRYFRVASNVLAIIAFSYGIGFEIKGNVEGQDFMVKTNEMSPVTSAALVILAVVSLVLDFKWRGGKFGFGQLVGISKTDSSTHNLSENEINAPVTNSFNPTNNNIGSVGTLNNADKIEIHNHAPQTPPEKKSPKFLTPPAANPPAVFKGRDNTLQEIRAALQSDGYLLLLSGLGGVGKTAVARAYWHHYLHDYDQMAWLDCISTIDNALLDDKLETALQLDIQNQSADQRRQNLLRALSNCPGTNLLIIDNVNDEVEVRNHRPSIHGWHVLITSRNQLPDLLKITKRLDVLDVEPAREAFKEFAENRNLDHGAIDALLSKVGRHTLLIELLGKLIQSGKYPDAASLHQALQSKGIVQAGGNVTLATDWHQMTQANLEQIVGQLFDHSQLPDTQQLWLSRLALLPSVFLPLEHLKNLFVSNEPDHDDLLNALNALSKGGWLEKDMEEGGLAYKLHPVIQAVVLHKGPAPTAEVEDLGQRLLALLHDDTHLQIRRHYVIYGLAWLQSHSDQLSKRNFELMRVLGRYFREIGDLVNAMAWFRQYKVASEKFQSGSDDEDFQRTEAIAWNEIGDIHRAQGRLELAMAAYQKSLLIIQKLATDNPSSEQLQRDLAIGHERTGGIHRVQGRLEEAMAAYQKSLAIRQELAITIPSSEQLKRDLTVSYERIGDTHQAQGRLEAAMVAYQKSLTITQELSVASPNSEQLQRDLTISHERIGDIHRAQGRLEEAMAAYQKSLAVRQELATASPGSEQLQRDLAISQNKIGDIHRAEGRLEEAMSAYQKSLAIGQQLAITNPSSDQLQRDLTVSYDRIGEIHRAEGRLEDAMAAYQKSLAIRQELATASPSSDQLQRDLAISQNKIGDIHQDEGRLEDAMAAFQKGLAINQALVTANPSSVEVHDGLFAALWRFARIANLQGDKAAALLHLQAALTEAQFRVDSRGTPDDRRWLQNTQDRLAALQKGKRPAGW